LTQKLSVLAKQISVVGICGAMMIFMVMALGSIWHSPIFTGLLKDTNPLIGLSIFSIIVGFFVMRFVLRPFFASMDMELNDIRLQLLTSVPMIVAVFGICLGVWGVFDDQGNVSKAMEMFRSLLTCFVVAVTIIVVAVPEGLPMMVTVSLAMNMMKMARENVLVRKLVASETIGSATVVCTDKTGTLTQNQMTATWTFLGMNEYQGDGFERMHRDPAWALFVDSVSVNSEAALHVEGDGAKETVEGVGNPTECALLRLLRDAGADYRDYRDRYPRLREVSHNSQRKLSLVVVERAGDKICYVKGAPDKLLDRCSHVFVDGERRPIETYRTEIQAALDAATGKALRVIAFTVKEGDDHCLNEAEGEKCLDCPGHALLALVGIADPIRPEVAAAVETCRRAGVEVKMITGDAEPTAIAIARQAGILSDKFDAEADTDTEIRKGELVLTSAELAAMDDQKLLEAIPSLKVLARSTPMDKLRLVKAMHREGEVVAMTGDGTNDAPALKFADVGVSMGITGTEVAKEASDIVLIDDNFKSIVTGIWWGRTLYQNIQRFLQFQLSVNVVALSCALIGPLVGIPLPLTVPQLLWINIIMDTFAAIALSCDPPRRKSMDRKPISRDASIITPSMGLSILLNGFYQVAILFTALYFGWFLTPETRFDFTMDPMGRGENLQALTVFFTIFVMFQFWHKFNCRSLRHDESPFELLHKNKLFLLIVGTITVVQIVMVQASAYLGIGEIFRTVALSVTQWLEIALLTVTIIPVAWVVQRVIHFIGLESDGGMADVSMPLKTG
ncbi:MAG TPA: calcium-translocating P-type ATPase, PMCA-type, partial [Planctomycetaceae bacterium]|nr:calcium-translocating P-type ATPase, PMCA-type [Planctomycetaceae bacterium]